MTNIFFKRGLLSTRKKIYLFIFILLSTFIVIEVIINYTQPQILKKNLKYLSIIHRKTKKYSFNCQKSKVEFDNSVAMKYISAHKHAFNHQFQKCEDERPKEDILKIEFFLNDINGEMELYRLKLNINYLLKFKNVKNRNFVTCYVQYFQKNPGTSDKSNPIRDQKIFFEEKTNNEIVVDKFGSYLINCKSNASSTLKIIFKKIFYILPIDMSKMIKQKELISRKIYEKSKLIKKYSIDFKKNPMFDDLELNECKKQNTMLNNKTNILILSFDSVSQNQFKRVFPITYKYLTVSEEKLDNNVFFENYHSVGYNTKPNYFPLLAGLIVHPNIFINASDEDLFFSKFDQYYYDNLPLIWKQFEKQGYLTMWLEETPSIGLFNFLAHGFRYSPCSYHSTTFMDAYDKYLNHKFCVKNDEPVYNFTLNKLKDFVYRMNSAKNKALNYFSMNLFGYYSHDYMAIPQNFDIELKNMLIDFDNRRFLDNTLLILLSDHGYRFGGYYADELGKLENTMPFLSIRLPKQFLNTEYQQNLINNRLKLISPFDVYKTLKHFSYINQNGILFETQNKKCENYFGKSSFLIRSLRGVSLIKPIDIDRTCYDALIPFNLCFCNKRKAILLNDFLKEIKRPFKSIKNYLTKEINIFSEKYRKRCKLFKFDKLLTIKKIISKEKRINFVAYDLEVMFQPGMAIFKMPLKRLNFIKNKNFEIKIYDKIERLSIYGNQSVCATKELQGFCYCF